MGKPQKFLFQVDFLDSTFSYSSFYIYIYTYIIHLDGMIKKTLPKRPMMEYINTNIKHLDLDGIVKNPPISVTRFPTGLTVEQLTLRHMVRSEVGSSEI